MAGVIANKRKVVSQCGRGNPNVIVADMHPGAFEQTSETRRLPCDMIANFDHGKASQRLIDGLRRIATLREFRPTNPGGVKRDIPMGVKKPFRPFQLAASALTGGTDQELAVKQHAGDAGWPCAGRPPHA